MLDFDEPQTLTERFDALEERLDLISTALGMLVAAISQQPVEIGRMRKLAEELGYEPVSPLLVAR